MAEYVPESPTSVSSCETWLWSPLPPIEEEEDVLVPYWENLHEDLFLDGAVLRQFVCTYERQERDLWNYLGPQ